LIGGCSLLKTRRRLAFGRTPAFFVGLAWQIGDVLFVDDDENFVLAIARPAGRAASQNEGILLKDCEETRPRLVIFASIEHCASASRRANCRSEPQMNFAPYPNSELDETFTSNSR
jgi:hypothetical protein